MGSLEDRPGVHNGDRGVPRFQVSRSSRRHTVCRRLLDMRMVEDLRGRMLHASIIDESQAAHHN